MTRADLPLLPLSTLNGGVHREDAEGPENRVVDGVDVIEDDGDLRRRDAFHAIAAVAPHRLPAGSAITYDGLTINYDRIPAGNNILVQQTTLHVGALEPFDGIELRAVVDVFENGSPPDIVVTRHTKLQVEFWNGVAWVAFDEVVDTTVRRVTDSNGDVWLRSLAQNGEVHWHRSQADAWVAGHQSLVDSQATSRYWVRLRFLDFANGLAPTAADINGTNNRAMCDIADPGITVFLRGPARSVIPTNVNNTPKLLIGSDRTPRGTEGGAQLGSLFEQFKKTEELRLIGSRVLQADEGGGFAGEVDSPPVNQAAPGEAWPSGTWTEIVAAGATSEGTDNTLERNQRGDVQYDWTPNQFRGAVVYADFALTGVVNDAARLYGQGTLALNAKWQDTYPADDHAWEGYRLVCITNGSGTGTPVGEEREIVRAPRTNNNVTIRWHQNFSILPDAQNRFDVRRPHSRVKIRPHLVSDDFEILTNTVDVLTPLSAAAFTARYEADFSSENGQIVHFQVGRPLHWEHRNGDFWDATFDTTTRKILLTNGQSSPLEYDGRSLRRLRALFDPDNARVQLWVGSLPDDVKNELRAHEIAGSKLRQTPPIGKFIATWHGHTILAGLQGRPYDIAYSAPSPNNDIWPLLYQTQIRDPFNFPITGIKPLRDRLVVFTTASIHALFPPNDNGLLQVEPIAMGTGFVSQRAVAHVGMDILIGAAPDGIYMLQGSDMQPVLRKWEHLVDGGANRGQLHHAVAAYSSQRNEFYIAFPGRGSVVNDYVGVYNTMKRRWWVWRAPWGGVADVAVQRQKDGSERLLFGMEDGTIAVMRKHDTDDGDTITGRARSVLHTIDTKKYRLQQLNLYALEQPASHTMTVRHYLDTTKTPFAAPSHSVKFSQGGPDRLDTGQLTVMRLGYERFVSYPFTIKEGAECSGYAYEVEGTSQWRIRRADLVITMVPVQPVKR